MAALLITYDLNKPGQDYEGLFEEIKSFCAWWHSPGDRGTGGAKTSRPLQHGLLDVATSRLRPQRTVVRTATRRDLRTHPRRLYEGGGTPQTRHLHDWQA